MAYPQAMSVEMPLADTEAPHDCHHCSRQSTQTGRLTRSMFAEVFARAKAQRA